MREWFSKKTLSDFMPCNRYTDKNVSDISINLFIVGFISTSVQLLLMREMMNISGGYELITGVFLGSWLLASAAGSVVAGKCGFIDIPKLNLAFSLSPFISLFLLVLLTRILLGPGETPGFLSSIMLTFLMLLPFCFVSGFTFMKLISSARTENHYVPGKSFSIETTGGIAAGVILSVLASGIFNTVQILVVILISGTAYTLLAFFIKGKRSKFAAKIIFIIVTVLVFFAGPDVLIRQLLMPGIKVTGTKDTPYGNITTGIYGNEQSTFYNHRLLSYSDDAIEREENVHYALLQTEKSKRVLIISGSLNSCLPELDKYNPEKVVFVENDPGLIKYTSIIPDTLPFKLDIQMRDAFRFVKENEKKSDAVILLLPPPSSLALNRYYTTEFFKEIKQNLSDGGVFMCSPGPGDYYLNKESVNLYSSIFNSLSDVFGSVTPVAGNKLYFIASDSELSVSFCRLADEKQIKNIYVSCDFMADDLIQRKSEELLSIIDRKIKQNRSAYPIACFHYQSYHLSKDPSANSIAIIILIAAFALSLFTIRRNNILMYLSASSLAGFEIIMLLSLQLTAGNMYQLTGIIIAALMAGLAAGSGMKLNIAESVPAKVFAFVLLLFYAVVAISLNVMLSLTNITAIILIITAVIPPSFITGLLFRKLTIRDNNGSLSSVVYSADLAGSALGFILVSALMVPVFGIRVSVFFLSGLIFAGILLGTNSNK